MRLMNSHGIMVQPSINMHPQGDMLVYTVLSFCQLRKNFIGKIRRAIMRYCNNGNDKYFAKWTAGNMDDCKKMFASTHTYHYKPLNKFAPTLPAIHEVDENLGPLKRGMPSYYPPLCLRHFCEMRYTCLVCRGQLSVSLKDKSKYNHEMLIVLRD